MSYFVYENWVADGHRARLHRAQCPSCNNGMGVHPNAGDRNGKWHGPFPSLADALEAAAGTGGRISGCRRCCGEGLERGEPPAADRIPGPE